MAYEGWLRLGDTEIVNAGRTVELSRVLGIDSVRQRRGSTNWIETAFETEGFSLGGFGVGPFGVGDGDALNYRDVREAPWYDHQFPASREFAGFLPLSIRGLEGSTATAETTEYVTDGGFSGAYRNSTLEIVVDGAIVASTERGAEYGLRWLNRVLRDRPGGTYSTGMDLRYFRYADSDAPLVHRRDVRVTRGTSVTTKRDRSCSSTWRVTFTLTAGDPFEYGEPVPVLSDLGGTPIFYGPNDNINLVRDANGLDNGSWVGDHTFSGTAGNAPPPALQNNSTLRLPLDGVYRQTQEPEFNVTAGDVYSISAQAWVHPDTIQGAGVPGNIWFALHYWDAQGNYLTGAGVVWDVADAGDGWVTRSNTFIVPENAATARVRIRTRESLRNGYVYVDDMRVFRVKSGVRTGLVEIPCAQPDYSPLQDPAYPALIAPPASPGLVPNGWIVLPGMSYTRYWARVEPIRPSTLLVVPNFTVVTTGAWRGLRLSLWPSSVSTDSRCDPLFSVVLNYVPPNTTLFIDGERQAVYSWDGISQFARRAESLAFSTEMGPVQWTSLNSDQALLVTMDTFAGEGSARVSLSLTPKSD